MRSKGYDRMDYKCEEVWSRYHGFLSSSKAMFIVNMMTNHGIAFYFIVQTTPSGKHFTVVNQTKSIILD